MIGKEERRNGPRCKAHIPIIFRTFNAPDYFTAKEVNNSNRGISFQTRFDLKPGTVVQVRCQGVYKSNQCNSSCEGCRTNTLAKIQWRRENKVAGALLYFVGAKYFEYGIGY